MALRCPRGHRRRLCAGVALAIVLAAFVADGGLRLEPTTDVEIGFLLAGGALCAPRSCTPPRARARSRRRRAAAFALLAVCTALSISWSVAPAESWLEANRTLAYLGLFAGGARPGRMAPRAGPRCCTASRSAA